MIQKATTTLYQFIIGLFSDEHLISHYNRAVARISKLWGGGGHYHECQRHKPRRGGLGISSSNKFSDLEAPKHHILYQGTRLVTRTGCAITGTL